ncbi:MAG: phosphoribosylglycinamide formyltransferase [Acidobacteria bacterium]|nr:phosphoribosylglycinamide formyltransferase [Acidobacteriota bacterium]
MRVGILISGRGSNMVSIAEACASPGFPASVGVVISDSPVAAGLDRAASMGLSTAVVEPGEHADRTAFERKLSEILSAHDCELVCLAGFMRILTSEFLADFPGRVLNIHPSLLPSFPGLDVQRKAIEHGVRFSGCTVHFVTAEMDAGPIVLQAAVPVESGDDPSILAARILEQEHRIYPEAVRLMAEGRLQIEGRAVQISP